VRERLVADRQHLVDQQHVGIGVDGDREAEADVHAGGVVLDRLFHEVAETGELHDLVIAPPDLALREAEHGAVDEDVLAPRNFGVKTGAKLNHGGDPPGDGDPPGGRLEHAGDQLQEGGLARAVAADHPERLAAGDREVDAGERLDGVLAPQVAGERPFDQDALQRPQAVAGKRPPVELLQPFDADRVVWTGLGSGICHAASTRVSRRRSKIQAPTDQKTRLTSAICAHRSPSGARPKNSTS